MAHGRRRLRPTRAHLPPGRRSRRPRRSPRRPCVRPRAPQPRPGAGERRRGGLDDPCRFLDHRTSARPTERRARLAGVTTTKGERVSETAAVATYADAETQVLSASNGVDYAYRTTGVSDAAPLVLLQHFRGNLDNWDPALIDALAHGRRVITFDNRGVAASSGRTPSTIAPMALDALEFIDGLGVGRSICSGFRSAVSWPRRSLWFALRRCAGWCSPLGSAGSEWNARLGRRRHRRRGQAPDFGRGAPERLLHGLAGEPGSGDADLGRVFGARSPVATRTSTGRPGWPNTTRSAPGGSRTTRSWSGSPRSPSPCLWPTETATP